MPRLPCLLLCLLWTSQPWAALHAAPPPAPSGLTATTLGVNTFRLDWQDNSNDESLFRVQARFVGDTTWNNLIDLNQGTGAGTGPLFFNLLLFGEFTAADLQFRMVAVRNGPPLEFSVSDIANAATTPAIATFNAPTGLTATASDGVVTLHWTDQANSEWGYHVEVRQGTEGSFNRVYVTHPNETQNVQISGHRPSTLYQYRVRGFKRQNPEEYTAYTPVLDVTTQALQLQAPQNLQAELANERDIGFSFSDPNTAEDGYRLEYRVAGDSEWSFLGEVGPSVSLISPVADLFDPATAYEFQVRAFFEPDENPENVQLSDPSNVATATTLFQAPDQLVVTPASDTALELAWQDNSAVEQGYAIALRRQGESDFRHYTYTAADSESALIAGLEPGTAYEFDVRAAYQASAPNTREVILESSGAGPAGATTFDGLTSADYVEVVAGQFFLYDIAVTATSPLLQAAVTNLPVGLALDGASFTLGGQTDAVGSHEATLTLTFENGWVLNRKVVLQVLAPPRPTALPPPPQLATGASTRLPLADWFEDPDVSAAARVSTNLGDFRIALTPESTPLTVSNFFAYATAGDYTNTLFHRSVPGFVLQGGGFRAEPDLGPDTLLKVPTRPPVPNEPGANNTRATVAMAKLADQPDSATNQFFVNLRNNGHILNGQNGGFTVFGRVPLADMAVPDAIAALPTGEYAITLDGAPSSLEDFPLTEASATIDLTKVVRIEQVLAEPPLSYAVIGNSNPTAVVARVEAGELVLEGLSAGVAVLTLAATDLDGNAAQAQLTVEVTGPLTFRGWATQNALPPGLDGPRDNPDGGSLDNFREFAFGGDPQADDDALHGPDFGFAEVSALDARLRLRLRFRYRKDAAVVVVVGLSPTLDPVQLTPLWNSALQDVDDPVIHSREDLGDFWRLEIRDPNPSSIDPARHLLLEAREPGGPSS